MWTGTKRWMHLVLSAGLVVGVALFVGCGGSSSGGSGSGSGGGGGGGSADNGGGSGGGGDANGGNNGGQTPGGGGNGSAVTIDHSTPEALFASMLDAARNEYYKGVAEAYAPKIQRDMAVGMVSMAASAGVVPTVNIEDIRPVLERHNISEDDLPSMGPQMQQQAEAIVDGLDDMTGFVGDMMSTLPDFTQGFTDTFGDAAVNATTLTDLEIEGDSATAQITAAGQNSGEDRQVNFVRIDGKWYVTD